MRVPLARGLFVVALAILPATAAPAASDASSPAVMDGLLRSGLRDLHQGLYRHAEERFREAARQAPGDPEPLLFVAFTHWWRLVLEETGPADGYAPFFGATDEAIGAGERRLESAPGDRRSMAAVGAARILRSHVEAKRRNYFQAAQEARRGKRLLERSLQGDPGMSAALFPLGALNYFADRVPLVVKGIRFILFLPGGDADLGLSQLRAVASSTDYFRTDARLLLAMICASREERCYEEGLRLMQEALQENPGSPLIGAAIGDLEMRLGRHDQAIRTYEESIRAAEDSSDPDRIRQRRWLRVALAEACAADWRLDRAADLLKEEAQEGSDPSAALARLKGRVEGELTVKREAAAFAQAGAPPGPGPDGVAARFLRGRSLLLAGRYRQAEQELAAASEALGDAPPWMEGWIELYSGMAEAGLGNRRAARGHFRRASDVKKFRSAERGLLELQDGAVPNPRCGG